MCNLSVFQTHFFKGDWLDKTKNLHEQGRPITEETEIEYAKQFFGDTIDQKDEFLLQLIYSQCVDVSISRNPPFSCPHRW